MATKVIVGGCFDLLHYGHIAFLKKAKEQGDYLIVLLESDEKVKKLKGDSRPIHDQNKRKEMLSALRFVDEVVTLPAVTTDQFYTNLIDQMRPDIIAVTEGDPKLEHKQKQAKEFGAKLVVIPKIHTPSTSQLTKLLRLE